MATIRSLMVRLGVEADTNTVKQFDRAIRSARTTMVRLGAAATAAAAAVGVFVAQTTSAGNAVAKSADAFGIGIEAYQEFQFAVQRATQAVGDGSATVNIALRTMSRLLVDFKNGSVEAERVFADLGLSLADVTGPDGSIRDLEELLPLVADGMAGLTDDAVRASAAQRLFGRSGADLLPLLSQGSAGLRELAGEAQALGVIMSEDTARASEMFVDNMTDIRGALAGLRNAFVGRLLPPMNRFFSAMRDLFIRNRDLIEGTFLRVADALIVAFEQLGDSIAAMADVAVLAFGDLESALKAFALAMSGAALAFGVVFAPVTTVILAVAAAIGIAYLAAQDFVTFIQGGDSVLGRLADRFLESAGGAEALRRALLTITAALFNGIAAMAEWWNQGTLVSNLFRVWARGLGFMLSPLIRIADLIRDIVGMVPVLGAAFEGLFQLPQVAGRAIGRAISGPTSVLDQVPGPSPSETIGGVVDHSVSNRSVSNTTNFGGNTVTINAGSADAKAVADIVRAEMDTDKRAQLALNGAAGNI